MMKKLPALLILFLFVLSCGLSMAAVAPATAQMVGGRQTSVGAGLKIMKISKNQDRIRIMNAAVERKSIVLRQKINTLRKAPGGIKPEKIVLLKESTQFLAENQKRFAAGQVLYGRKVDAIRANKRAGNHQAALAGLDDILAVQQEQISNLRAISTCLDRLILLL
jgi:hypothetical protein